MLRLRWLALLVVMTASPICAQEDMEEPKPIDEDAPYANVQLLARAMQLLRQDYVDQKKVSYHQLTYAALKGMLSALDPHSEFMDPNDFRGMKEDTKSEFGGLGIVVTLQDGALTIVNPMEDTPSYQAGILPNDRILRIDGEATDKMTLSRAIEKLRGDVGEKITLTIQRPSTKEIKDYPLTRTTIKMKSVKDAQILPVDEANGKKIGYVRLVKFAEPTATELAKALEDLEKQGMEALVLDLRNNPGGLLGSAVDVCGLFVPAGTKIVSTKGTMPSRDYRTLNLGNKPRTYPLVILVNYASASGSEIVAGALRDLKRAVVVGETTFGKGSVQSVYPLPDGSAVKFTTNKYFTPGGEVIHENGVVPTIRATMTAEQEYDLFRQRRDDSRRPLDPTRDPQLHRAVDLLEGDLIYTERKPSGTGKGS